MSKTLIPQVGRLLIRVIEVASKAKVGGIFIPEASQEISERYEVIAIGQDGTLNSGREVVYAVEIGDTVVINNHCGQNVKIDGVGYKIISNDDVAAIEVEA